MIIKVRNNFILISIIFLLSLILACKEEKKITVLAAAGLKPIMEKLVREFQNETKIKVEIIYGGSGYLLAQLKSNLKGDVFIPADEYYISKAQENALLDNKSIRTLAYHQPVLVVRKEKAKEIKNIFDLKNKSIRVGLGDEKACAIGKVSSEILQKLGIIKEINIVVRTPTVNQLILYLLSGQIDASIIWKELALPLQKEVKIFPIQYENGTIFQKKIEVSLTSFSKNKEEAQKFIKFLLQHREEIRHWLDFEYNRRN